MSLPLHHFKAPYPDDIALEVTTFADKPALATLPAAHRHTFYEVLLITVGAGQHVIDFAEYSVQPGAMYFIRPGQVHCWQLAAPIEGYVLLFTQAFLDESHIQPDFLQQPALLLPGSYAPALYLTPAQMAIMLDITTKMYGEYHQWAVGRVSLLQAFLQMLLIYARRFYPGQAAPEHPTAAEDLTQRFLACVEQQFARVQSVEAYAEQLAVTPNHLSTTVKAMTGATAGVLIRRRIALEARRLLVHTPQTIREIGYQLNFDDPAYFSRFFEREAGMRPEAFRRHFQKKYHNRKD